MTADSIILAGSNRHDRCIKHGFCSKPQRRCRIQNADRCSRLKTVLTADVGGVGAWQANEKVGNDTTGEVTGSDSVLNMISLTQAEYDTALANFPATIKATTLYIIKDHTCQLHLRSLPESKIYLGSNEIDASYLGGNLVFSELHLLV